MSLPQDGEKKNQVKGGHGYEKRIEQDDAPVKGGGGKFASVVRKKKTKNYAFKS